LGLGFALVIAILILLGKPSFANVRFQIKTPSQEAELFLINVRISHYAFHSTTSKIIATKILPSNQSHLIRISFTNPIFYNHVYLNYYHPEYVHSVKTSKKLPSILQTVSFPELQPQKYLDHIHSEDSLKKNPPGIIGGVRDHIYYFLNNYLPQLDKMEGNKEKELTQYLALFQELSKYAENTLNSSTHSYSDSVEKNRKENPNYAMKLKWHEERLFKDLTDYLTKINWLLSLSRAERNLYRELQEKLKNPIEFIHSVITSHDQDRIYQFLNQRLKSRSNKNLEKQISWTNETTNISYTLIHRGGFARIKDKVRLNCFKNKLQVDLTNLYPVSLPNLKPNLSNNYCHIPPNDWKME
jgi:hypothetical protein